MLSLRDARSIAVDELTKFEERLAASDGRAWTRQTPCPSWNVERLARHVVAVAWQQAEAFRRATLDVLEAPSYLEVGTPLPRLVEALERAREELSASVDAVADLPDLLVPLPFSTMPVAFAVQALVVEYGVHRWDLDTALDEDDGTLRSEVIETHLETVPFTLAATSSGTAPTGHGYVLRGSRRKVDLVSRGGQWVTGTPDVAATMCGDDSAIALFTLGRIAADDDRLTVSGDSDLARAFTRYFPGLS